MIGIREPDIYGQQDYQALEEFCRESCREAGKDIPGGIDCEIFQSNHEGDLVDRIQQAYFDGTDGIVINPGAYTHTSIAIMDALEAVRIPAVEVHLSDISAREDFRQLSYTGMACVKTYMGIGFAGYRLAVVYLVQYLKENGGERQ